MDISKEAYEAYSKGIGYVMASSKMVYESAKKVGFTEEQAFLLATTYMTNTFQDARKVTNEEEP